MFMDKATPGYREYLPLSGPPTPSDSACPPRSASDSTPPPAPGAEDISANALGDDREYELGQYYFALGPTGTGLRLHAHNPTWNALIAGRKRW